MTRVSVRFEGGKELEKALGGLGTLYRRRKAARDALLEAAAPVHDAAQDSAPVRSGGPEKRFASGGGSSRVRRRGALRIHVGLGTRLTRAQSRRNRDKMPVEVYVGTNDRAGRLQEFGTRFAAANPWLRRAWDATRLRALELLKDALWRQISRQAALEAKASLRAARKSARGR